MEMRVRLTWWLCERGSKPVAATAALSDLHEGS